MLVAGRKGYKRRRAIAAGRSLNRDEIMKIWRRCVGGEDFVV